jgi:anaerobic selenocysteine-containing dehydrogenase
VHQGACPLDCPDTCAWQVTVDGGRAVALRGDKRHPFTRGGLCGKVTHYIDAVYAPDRLLQPLVRVGDKGVGRDAFRRASWDEAIGAAAAGIQRAIDRHGPEAVVPYHYAGTLGVLQAWSLGNRLFAHLGASRLGYTICTGAATAALGSIYGGKVGVEPESIARAGLVVLWGTNLLATNVHQWAFVAEARRRGAHVVCIDPLRTPTAERCDEHLAPVPGTDGALALGLMRVVLDQGAVDRDWVTQYVTGWDELEARLAEWPVERAAAITGVAAEAITRLGERIAATRPTALRAGLGLQRHAGAGQALRAVMAIPLLTGDFRYPGGGALCSGSGHHRLGNDAAGAPTDLPLVPARTLNMSRLAEVLTAPLDPPVTALVVYNANPAATVPDQERLVAGFGRRDLFTTVLEQRWTDTCDWADVVLPATMQFEHIDVLPAYGHHYVSLNRPAIAPVGDALPNTEIFRRLATALGLHHPRLHDDDETIVDQVLAGSGVDRDMLEAQGWVRGTGIEPDDAPFAKGGFPTPDGRARLLDRSLVRLGLDPLVGYEPPAEVLDADLAARYPLALVSPAARFFLNSTFGSLDWHRAKMGEPRIHLHPADAAARSLQDGDAARVFNDRGSFEAMVAVDDAAPAGVAFTYKAYWASRSPGGRTVNATTPVRDADFGGAPTFHDNRVEVERLPA